MLFEQTFEDIFKRKWLALMDRRLKIINDTTKLIDKRIKNIYQHTKPSARFFFEIHGTDSIINSNYVVTLSYRVPGFGGTPNEILATLDPVQIPFNIFVDIMREVFIEWRFPIVARDFLKEQHGTLKRVFRDALRFDYEY